MKNSFGNEENTGGRLSIYLDALDWFRERNIEIVAPYHTVQEISGVVKFSNGMSGVHTCEICGAPLYKFLMEAEVPVDLDPEDYCLVQQKKHMIFTDTTGKRHYTCNGMSVCYRKTNHVPFSKRTHANQIVIDADKDALPFDEAFDIVVTEPLDETSTELLDNLKSRYQLDAVPFINKWGYRSVNKQNLLEIKSDIEALVNSRFISLFDPKTRLSVVRQVLKQAGVKI